MTTTRIHIENARSRIARHDITRRDKGCRIVKIDVAVTGSGAVTHVAVVTNESIEGFLLGGERTARNRRAEIGHRTVGHFEAATASRRQYQRADRCHEFKSKVRMTHESLSTRIPMP